MEEGTPQELLKKHLQLYCTICQENYNQSSHKPYILCRNSHFCCFECLNNLFNKENQNTQCCPFCKIKIKKNNAVEFRQFESYQLLRIDLVNYMQKFDLAKNTLLKTANRSFSKGQFDQTIEICKGIILMNIGHQQQFQALGNSIQYRYYSKDQELQFYTAKSKNQMNVFDLIIISARMLDKQKQLLKWMLKRKQKFHKNSYFLYGIGILSSNLQMHQQAIKYYQQALLHNSELSKIHRWLAYSLYLNNNLDQARWYAEQALKKEQQPYSLYIYAISNRREQKFSFSCMLFQSLSKIIEIDPNYLPSLFRFGLEFQRISLYSQALNYFNMCIQKSPSFYQAKLMAAKCYLKLGNPTQAIQLLKQDLMDTKNQQSLLIIGQAYLHLNKNAEALENIQKAKALNQNNPNIYIVQSQVYIRQNNMENAIKSLQTGLLLDQTSQQLLKYLLDILSKTDDKQKIISLANHYKKSNIVSNQIIIKFGDYFYSKNEYEKSLDFFKKLTNNQSISHIVYQKIINAGIKTQNYKLALDYSLEYNKYHNSSIESWRRITEINQLIKKKNEAQQGMPRKRIHLE